MGYIYKITNLINGKVYIGQTGLPSVQDRFNEHVKKAKQHVNRYLYDAMNYYGVDNFSVEELEHCDKNELDSREIFWISHYHSNDKNFGYNMTSGGGGGDTWTHNPNKAATSAKLRLANTGKKRSAEFSKRLSEIKKGNYYIDVDTEQLTAAIQEGKTIDELCSIFGLSYSSLIRRCKIELGKSIRDIRTETYVHPPKQYTDDMRRQLSEIRRERWAGDNNPNYKDVDSDILHDLIKKNSSVDEITKYFDISKPTLYSKIKQYFGINLRKLRKEISESDY